jgi:exodeoxyribonuclease VII large subunit
MSPLKVLGRGYAMAQSEAGTVLRSAKQVSVGDKVSVQLAEGMLRCTVNEKGE